MSAPKQLAVGTVARSTPLDSAPNSLSHFMARFIGADLHNFNFNLGDVELNVRI
jgi:hypothetical protein